MSNSPRYYLHGDEAEDSPETYYCKKCDVFFSKDHFEKPCGGENHFKIYHRHLDNVASSKKHVTIFRPAQAKNISHIF